MDSLSVYDKSILISDADGNNYDFTYDLNSGFLRVDLEEGIIKDSLHICYRAFPYALNYTFRNRSLAEDYDSMAYFRDNRVKASTEFDFREEVFSSDKLNQSGNLTRGISFGNAQNVFVNSSLNLQMDGELAENLQIRASITDQNVPFQPEGNTQQIQDFDNVLIELYNDNFNLSGGDVVLQQRKSQFLRYYKNVQGLQFTTDYQVNDKWKASSQASLAIAKGKFASVQLEIREGVMGPYRIRGPGNERFVIVMANSEKVFLDGKQLQRGFNQDYIIDYNQGEITFTPSVVITQYSRVRVDFEYAERNFSRSILTANHIQQSDKTTFYLNYYREKDDRNRPLFFDLSDADKRLLASVGDDLGLAATPRIDSIAFDPNRILYRKVEEYSEEGELRVYYEYSTDPEQAFFAVSFLETTPGQGDYRRRQQLANGVVYEYVPPQNGVSQGNFTIRSPLPVPNKRQMMTTGVEVKLGKYERAYAEVAFSDTDDNLFSELDNEDNRGFGVKSGLITEKRPVGWLKGYLLDSKLDLEYNSTNFAFIDRLRYIEFDRDWGLTPEALEAAQQERIAVLEAKLEKSRDELISYSLSVRQRGDILSGIQQAARVHQRLGSRMALKSDGFALDSRVGLLQNEWYRYEGELSYRSAILVPGYKLHLDRNRVLHAERDSVVSTAMNFLEHQVFVRTNDTLDYAFFAQASWREDQFPLGGEMVPETRAFTNQYGFQRRMGSHDLKSTFTYRRLEHLMRMLPEESTVMGKLDYLGSLFDSNLRNEISYALGNGRELRREFVFLPVPTGDGTHTWRDDNADGVQQLNEFYLAINPEEKNFIKVFVPTDDYIQAYTTLFNYRLNAKFPDSWRTEKGWKSFLQKFSNTTNWAVEKKITSSDLGSRITPFLGNIPPADLVSARGNLRSSFFFNRSSAKFGADYSIFNSQHKQLLSGGYEELQQRDSRINTRYNINKQVNLQILVSSGLRQATSDFLDNRNYRIYQRSIGPELAIQPSSFFRSSLKYSVTDKVNDANTEIDEQATLHQVGLNVRYAKAIKTTLNSQLSYTHIVYNGIPNSPTGYEMLQALTVGGNYVWNINWLQKIGEGLQLTMVYEGRNSEGLNRVIHTGRMQVSALF
ncbi:MAG: hypothetical protein JJU34_01770 [Lunatimonas sp.]|nr:hypothetical protein [Lunatimonas sp.]